MGDRYICDKCEGTGLVRWGKCFACRGRGDFASSPEQRAAAKQKRAEKTALRHAGAQQENRNRSVYLAVMNIERGDALFMQMRLDHGAGREWTPAQLASAREKLRAEAEARRAREAEELAAREAAEAAARQERERAEAAEQARKDAEVRAAEEIERAKREAAEAVERAQQEAADEIARERERAAQIERERQEEDDRQRQAAEEEAKRKADEQAALEADEARRVEVMGAIEAALAAMTGRATPRAIAEALMAGEIPHIQVVL